jgi:hypothetical protein
MTGDETFVVCADDSTEPPRIHVIVFRNNSDWELGWNVACCGEALDDYALVSFENTEGGYPLSQVCGRCFEALGSDVQRGDIG